MTDYRHLRIDLEPCTETATDLLAAFLADAGYESFVPDDTGLSAYIAADLYDPNAVTEILDGFPVQAVVDVHDELVPGQDWNEDWEKNYFKPIIVGGECVIHSTFHTDVPTARYDIVIDPKMAFGTGHHATTSLMIEYILSLPLQGADVVDMGTGTGILAILCSMTGARRAVGIEIDPDAADNAREHLMLNNRSNVVVLTGDASLLPSQAPADLFMANINRNIILADIELYAKALKSGGHMLLSGFYEQDVPMIQAAAEPLGLVVADSRTRDNWCALHLRKA